MARQPPAFPNDDQPPSYDEVMRENPPYGFRPDFQRPFQPHQQPPQQPFPPHPQQGPGFGGGYSGPGQQHGVQPTAPPVSPPLSNTGPSSSVTVQPQPGQPRLAWMERPVPVPGCPQGPEYLCQLDRIFIEPEDPSQRQQTWGYGLQPGYVYHFSVTDNQGQDVLRIRHKLNCCSCCTCCACCCCECCSYVASVEDCSGAVLGYVRSHQCCCTPRYTMWTLSESRVKEVKGPCCACCRDRIKLRVYDFGGGRQTGLFNKRCTGLQNGMSTGGGQFCVSFPVDMDVKYKAVMIGANFVMSNLCKTTTQETG